MHRTSVPYGTRTSVVVATAFAVVTALLVPALALGPPGAPATSTMELTSQNVSWATYPTGGLQVIFPSTLPQVDLVDRANSSLGAALQVDAILELQPGGLPHPTIVAAAFPTQLASFNATPTANLSDAPVAQAASLDVHAVGASLWSTTGLATYLGPAIGSAALFLNYTTLPSSSGVAIQWSVVGWPSGSPSDLLALELHLGLTQGIGVTPCTGAASGDIDGPATCAGAPIPTQGIAWDPTISRVVATGPSGDSTSVSWPPTTAVAGAGAVPPEVGTFAPWNSSAEVVLATPVNGATTLSGDLAFSLFPPVPTLPAPAPQVLRGDLVPYLVVVAGSLALAVAGVLAYRRRDRRLRDEL